MLLVSRFRRADGVYVLRSLLAASALALFIQDRCGQPDFQAGRGAVNCTTRCGLEASGLDGCAGIQGAEDDFLVALERRAGIAHAEACGYLAGVKVTIRDPDPTCAPGSYLAAGICHRGDTVSVNGQPRLIYLGSANFQLGFFAHELAHIVDRRRGGRDHCQWEEKGINRALIDVMRFQFDNRGTGCSSY